MIVKGNKGLIIFLTILFVLGAAGVGYYYFGYRGGELALKRMLQGKWIGTDDEQWDFLQDGTLIRTVVEGTEDQQFKTFKGRYEVVDAAYFKIFSETTLFEQILEKQFGVKPTRPSEMVIEARLTKDGLLLRIADQPGSKDILLRKRR